MQTKASKSSLKSGLLNLKTFKEHCFIVTTNGSYNMNLYLLFCTLCDRFFLI